MRVHTIFHSNLWQVTIKHTFAAFDNNMYFGEEKTLYTLTGTYLYWGPLVGLKGLFFKREVIGYLQNEQWNGEY